MQTYFRKRMQIFFIPPQHRMSNTFAIATSADWVWYGLTWKCHRFWTTTPWLSSAPSNKATEIISSNKIPTWLVFATFGSCLHLLGIMLRIVGQYKSGNPPIPIPIDEKCYKNFTFDQLSQIPAAAQRSNVNLVQSQTFWLVLYVQPYVHVLQIRTTEKEIWRVLWPQKYRTVENCFRQYAYSTMHVAIE